MANERDYSATSDLRDYSEVPEDFVGDTQLDNRTTVTPWGEFHQTHWEPFIFSLPLSVNVLQW